jgi:hypothetical protein
LMLPHPRSGVMRTSRPVRRVHAQCERDAVAQLRLHPVRNVGRACVTKYTPRPFDGTSARPLDRFEEVFRSVTKEQVRLVEKEYERRLLDVADFRQPTEQFR